MLKRNKRRTGRQSLTPSAASVVPLGDDRLPALAVVRVGLAVASAGRAEGKVAGAEPRDADAGALRLVASARAALKITEQAADAADPQTSAAGLTETGSFRTAANGRRDGDAERCNDQLSMEMAAHGRPDRFSASARPCTKPMPGHGEASATRGCGRAKAAEASWTGRGARSAACRPARRQHHHNDRPTATLSIGLGPTTLFLRCRELCRPSRPKKSRPTKRAPAFARALRASMAQRNVYLFLRRLVFFAAFAFFAFFAI